MADAPGSDALTFSDNPDSHRFELHAGGELAGFAEYSVVKNGMLLSHTEVLPAFEGRGIGSALARQALDEVRRRSSMVIPVCPFIAAFLRKHPDYQDLVSADSRRAYRI